MKLRLLGWGWIACQARSLWQRSCWHWQCGRDWRTNHCLSSTRFPIWRNAILARHAHSSIRRAHDSELSNPDGSTALRPGSTSQNRPVRCPIAKLLTRLTVVYGLYGGYVYSWMSYSSNPTLLLNTRTHGGCRGSNHIVGTIEWGSHSIRCL